MSEHDHDAGHDHDAEAVQDAEAHDAEHADLRPDAAAASPDPTRTGVASVDAAAERLSELTDAPVEAHVGIYEDVHHRLQEGLADLDEQ